MQNVYAKIVNSLYAPYRCLHILSYSAEHAQT